MKFRCLGLSRVGKDAKKKKIKLSSSRISQKRKRSILTHHAAFLTRKTPLQVFLVWTAGWTWVFFLCRQLFSVTKPEGFGFAMYLTAKILDAK